MFRFAPAIHASGACSPHAHASTIIIMDLVYLDNNATTRPAPEVVDAMLPYLTEWYGNPSSVHRFGQRARQAIDQARAQLAALIGCADSELLFTGGGTESINTDIRGLLSAVAPDPERPGGTENVPGIGGFGNAEELPQTTHVTMPRASALRDRLKQTNHSTLDDTQVNGRADARLPNTSNNGFARLEAEAIL